MHTYIHMQVLRDPEPVLMTSQDVNWEEQFQEQENEPVSWGQATGLKQIHPPDKLQQSLARASHKNYLFSQVYTQAPTRCKLEIMMLPLSIHLYHWCERPYVDVKRHWITVCGPTGLIADMYSVNHSFPPFCCWMKLKKEYAAVIIITVNPFEACHIPPSSGFTFWLRFDVMILHCSCTLRSSYKWENYSILILLFCIMTLGNISHINSLVLQS